MYCEEDIVKIYVIEDIFVNFFYVILFSDLSIIIGMLELIKEEDEEVEKLGF